MSERDGAGVVLRPVYEEDLAVFERFLTDPEAAGPFQWYGWADPARFRREWQEDGMIGEDGGRLAVATGPDVHGFVGWRKRVVSRSSYCWVVGIQLLPEARGRGVGTRAQELLVRHLFAHTPVERVQADTEVENVAEQRALEKCGFTREGVLRRIVFRDGQWRDGVMYSMVRGDLGTP
ncbi:GNAT family N-acetyltransferase [Streptomyces longispororuber]|uniref:GNAT family N-acetyltransferase n=1 Tax=Streptomyces longispororuber TaxID=68230 RepID=UPI00210BF694|nr:GNAT family protein [Streptomyces longispororuber]MCQ4209285.1 GNAT family N-acetyltransferase [Streptomyces longispororuber]